MAALWALLWTGVIGVSGGGLCYLGLRRMIYHAPTDIPVIRYTPSTEGNKG